MKRKVLSSLLILWLAGSTLAAIGFINLTNANPSSIVMAPIKHAYIRSNGNIDPPTLPIQRSDNVYVLTDDILNYTIEIQRDNIVIDGNGFTLTAIGDTSSLVGLVSGYASIQITNKSNIIIKNITFDKCWTGVSVKNASSIVIIQNIMENGGDGIYMHLCTNCSVIDNRLTDNSGPGLMIINSTFLTIAYNTISRNHAHGGWLAVSYSNICRNNITDNYFTLGNGLYLYGPNSYNHIFENNFINNEYGLFYQGARDISVYNSVYNNYWNNYKGAIFTFAADAISGVDQSPLTSPISTSFNPSLFPLSLLTPTPPSPTVSPTLTPPPPSDQSNPDSLLTPAPPTPSEQSTSESFPTTMIIARMASVALIGVGLLVYLKKRKC